MYETIPIHQRKSGKIGLTILVVVVASVAVVLAYFAAKTLSDLGVSSRTSSDLDDIIVQAGKRHFIDPLLIKAVIWRESRFRPNAKGAKGEIGLMQIIPKYAVRDWERVHRVDIPSEGILFDPTLNVEIGSWYLGRALRHWRGEGSGRAEELALCEYNAGRSAVKEWPSSSRNGDELSWIKVNSTRSYVRDIMKKYEEYRRMKP